MAILVCIYGLLYIYLSLYTNIFYPILSLVYMYNTIHWYIPTIAIYYTSYLHDLGRVAEQVCGLLGHL